jgi:hypothetical protein
MKVMEIPVGLTCDAHRRIDFASGKTLEDGSHGIPRQPWDTLSEVRTPIRIGQQDSVGR